jgi:hypothetical protein
VGGEGVRGKHCLTCVHGALWGGEWAQGPVLRDSSSVTEEGSCDRGVLVPPAGLSKLLQKS